MNNILPFLDDVNVPNATTTSELHTGQRHWKLKDFKFFYNQNVMNVINLRNHQQIRVSTKESNKTSERSIRSKETQGMSTNE